MRYVTEFDLPHPFPNDTASTRPIVKARLEPVNAYRPKNVPEGTYFEVVLDRFVEHGPAGGNAFVRLACTDIDQLFRGWCSVRGLGPDTAPSELAAEDREDWLERTTCELTDEEINAELDEVDIHYHDAPWSIDIKWRAIRARFSELMSDPPPDRLMPEGARLVMGDSDDVTTGAVFAELWSNHVEPAVNMVGAANSRLPDHLYAHVDADGEIILTGYWKPRVDYLCNVGTVSPELRKHLDPEGKAKVEETAKTSHRYPIGYHLRFVYLGKLMHGVVAAHCPVDDPGDAENYDIEVPRDEDGAGFYPRIPWRIIVDDWVQPGTRNREVHAFIAAAETEAEPEPAMRFTIRYERTVAFESRQAIIDALVDAHAEGPFKSLIRQGFYSGAETDAELALDVERMEHADNHDECWTVERIED